MADDLEKKVESSDGKSWISKAWDWTFALGAATATTALSLATVGSLGAIVGAAFAGGGLLGTYLNKDDERSLGERVLHSLNVYSAVNAVIYPMVLLGDITFPLIPNDTLAGWLGRGLYASTAYNAAFLGTYTAAEHLIENKGNPEGLEEKYENFYNFWERAAIGFAPGYTLAANGITSLAFGGLSLPTFAWNAVPFGAYHNAVPLPPPKEKSYSPTPALSTT
jgi:hypothetical protein